MELNKHYNCFKFDTLDIPGYNCDSLFPINCGEEFYKTHKIVNSFNPTYRCGQTPNSDWI